MRCECEDLKGVKLAQCLSPPPGDYGLELEVSEKISIVVAPEGLYLKQAVFDDDLPFTRTIIRPINEEFLNHVNIRGVDKTRLACLAAKALINASRHGSITAEKKLKRCKNIVEKLISNC